MILAANRRKGANIFLMKWKWINKIVQLLDYFSVFHCLFLVFGAKTTEVLPILNRNILSISSKFLHKIVFSNILTSKAQSWKNSVYAFVHSICHIMKLKNMKLYLIGLCQIQSNDSFLEFINSLMFIFDYFQSHYAISVIQPF